MGANLHEVSLSEQEWSALIQRLGLAPRQAEVMKHILHGKADRQIAIEMGISTATVRTHLGRLFRKYGVNDRVELILYVATVLWDCGN